VADKTRLYRPSPRDPLSRRAETSPNDYDNHEKPDQGRLRGLAQKEGLSNPSGRDSALGGGRHAISGGLLQRVSGSAEGEQVVSTHLLGGGSGQRSRKQAERPGDREDLQTPAQGLRGVVHTKRDGVCVDLGSGPDQGNYYKTRARTSCAGPRSRGIAATP